MIITRNKFKKNIKLINKFFKSNTHQYYIDLRKLENYIDIYQLLRTKLFNKLTTFINSLIMFPTTSNHSIKPNKETYFKILDEIINICALFYQKSNNNIILFNKESLFNCKIELDVNLEIFQNNNIDINLLKQLIFSISILVNKESNYFYKENDLYIIIANYLAFQFFKIILIKQNNIDNILRHFNEMIFLIKKYYKYYFNEFTYIINS